MIIAARSFKRHYCYLSTLASVLFTLFASTLVSAADASAELDTNNSSTLTTAAQSRWQALSDTELKNLGLPTYCKGHYQAPTLIASDEAFIEADKARFAFNQQVNLAGDVLVRNGPYSIQADAAEYDIAKRSLAMQGNIELESPELLIKGSSATIGTDINDGDIRDSSYVLNQQHIRGSAKQILRSGDQKLSIIDGFYTQCAPEDNTWAINAKRIDLDVERGIGTAKGAKVTIFDTPILYIPYIQFPLGDTRKSGLLWPAISTARSSSGLDITVPIYWNIAPQWDATIAPRSIGTRATGLELETRYLNRFGSHQFSSSYINDRDNTDARWLASYQATGQIGQHWFHEVDITRISDDLFFEDFDATTLDVRFQTHLRQQGRLSYWNRRHTGLFEISQYQTIEPSVATPVKTLPRLHWRTLRQGQHLQPELTALVDIGQFDSDVDSDLAGVRSRFEAGIYLPLEWQAGFVHTHLQTKSVRFEPEASTQINNTTNNRNTVFSVDTGLRFERIKQGRRISLEPRAYYLYADPIDNQQNPLLDTSLATDSVARRFSDTQFIGYDRLDSANDLSLGITSRWYNQQAKEVLSAAIAQTFFLVDKRTQLDELINRQSSASNIVGSIHWQAAKNWQIESHSVFDKSLKQIQNGHARALYNNDRGLFLGFTQVFNRNATVLQKRNQTEISAAIPVNSQWTAYGQLHYDHINQRDVQHTLGVAREDCCWRMRLVLQDTIATSDIVNNAQTSFHIQFELKGLGSTGDAILKVLEDAIYGFTHE